MEDSNKNDKSFGNDTSNLGKKIALKKGKWQHDIDIRENSNTGLGFLNVNDVD